MKRINLGILLRLIISMPIGDKENSLVCIHSQIRNQVHGGKLNSECQLQSQKFKFSTEVIAVVRD